MMILNLSMVLLICVLPQIISSLCNITSFIHLYLHTCVFVYWIFMYTCREGSWDLGGEKGKKRV